MAHIFNGGRPVAQGEVFEPTPGYSVIFVRMEAERLILRDSAGEFSRPIMPHTIKPLPPRQARLGERRTLLEETPDARPIVDETIYLMTHQMCVPGGWQDITSVKVRGPQGHAGIYGPEGQMMDITKMRDSAKRMAESVSKQIARHPYTRLAELVSKVELQEGTQGEPGAWDDPAVAMEICQILRDSKTL